MGILLITDLIDLRGVQVLGMNFGELVEGLVQWRERFMVGEVGVGEDGGSGCCCEFMAASGESAPLGFGRWFLRVGVVMMMVKKR